MPPPSDRDVRTVPPRPAGFPRFTPAERWVHQATALLAGVCIATAACLYISPLAELVGRRRLVVTVHEWSGIALPLPVLLGLASRALRFDLGRLNRFGTHDRRWLRAALRRQGTSMIPSGKFNAGQKVYAAWTAGAGLVMVGTGLLLWFPDLVSLSLRTGATFVHDWLALAIGVVVAGHIWRAARDPGALEGMWRGSVSREWADREHRLWRREMDGEPESD
ncbi:cytochrome b/b6 domain-containing protein [Streptomyces sp. AC512_CC834]|uniref:cytochrome b/b6 domain-containing protein n=1 Tax=Streptomyces sp. AC512_CC834 TaxID=2823691 RepID=UPI001C27BFE6|nr:cytochrome b/b6 domain-containing protein [Streptomyces sp. AC512_CC834]